jgi:hypothetical protein
VFNWSGGGNNGRPVSTYYVSIDGGGYTSYSTSGGTTIGYGCGTGHSISAYVVDSMGDQSSTASASASTAPCPPPTTYSEATGYGPVQTWSDPNGPSGTEGNTLSANTVYQVTCVTTGTAEGPSGDSYWYQISGTSDYGSADAFCDEGATTCPNGFAGTPAVDPNVPTC